MKTLKLEVGKTYRNRKGEEVKILRKGNKDWKGWDYWVGSNGEWYYEGGKWSCVTKDHPDDLIEEVASETRHTFKIPDGAKEVTVEQIGNRIVVEMVPEEVESNPKTMQVEDIPEIDRIREWVETHLNDGYYNQQGIAEVIEDYLKYREGEK